MNKFLIGMLMTSLLLLSNAFGKKSKDFSILIKSGTSIFPTIEFESGISRLFALQYGITTSGFGSDINNGILVGQLGIPLWFKFRFLQDKPFGIYIAPGVSINAVGSSRERGVILQPLGGFDFGVGALIGLQYYINDKFKIFFDITANVYLINSIIIIGIAPGVAFTFGRNTKTK